MGLLLKDVPPGRKLVALGHGSKMASKIWPAERFNALCRRLLAFDPNLYFLLLGDKSEYPHGESVRKGLETDSLNISGATSVIESAAALQTCTLYIGNDTGTMHLAGVMGTPVVAIFSARDNPGRWEPYGDKNTVLQGSGLPRLHVEDLYGAETQVFNADFR